MPERIVTATTTSSFGVSRRESHDAGDFYSRFTPPDLSRDEDITAADRAKVDVIHCWDARDMRHVDDRSVALVVTSPPYFAGKEYEETLGEGGVPATYLEYLQLLEDVFAQCVDKLEPGGRLAVNVANLGRKPFRSLASDVIHILQDRLRLLLRGEIIWVKGKGAGSSCAWGSFQSAANPVLRDLTERIVVASKGRFDRALSRRKRASMSMPSVVTVSEDEFMESTTDIWHMQPESAHRVGHPAPFPVELPERLINLFTYRDDVVLDPFIGSGTVAVAAVLAGRRYVGYDTDARYVAAARERVAALDGPDESRGVAVPATPEAAPAEDDALRAAVRAGKQAKEIAHTLLQESGFRVVARDQRVAGGVDVSFVAIDARGGRWLFDVAGTFTSGRGGLRRSDAVWKALSKAAVIRSAEGGGCSLVFLTTALPGAGPARAALKAAKGDAYTDVVDMLAPGGQRLLKRFAAGAPPPP